MSRFHFDLAAEKDDTDIRSFLASQTMPGRIHLRFLTEPSYFEALAVHGEFSQTMLCRDRASDEVVAIGCRSIRTAMVDGDRQPVGYLSLMRSAEHVRSGGLLRRGYRFLRELHEDGKTDHYISSIARDNTVARTLLTSGRSSLPTYAELGAYTTFVINCASRSWQKPAQPTSGVRRAEAGDASMIAARLKTRAERFRYAPAAVIDAASGIELSAPGLDWSDCWVVDKPRQSDEAGGCLALWDQRSFRQVMVGGYDRVLRHGRLGLNALAALQRAPRLPAPGTFLNLGYVAFGPANNPNDFRPLLREVCREAVRRGIKVVLLGCFRDDPIAAEAKRASFMTYQTDLFRVFWEDGSTPTRPRISPEDHAWFEVGSL